MESPRPSLIAATGLAFDRMKNILFRPFDMGKWFILGFSAWLATLLEGGGSSSGSYSDSSGDTIGESMPSVSEMLDTVLEWINEHLLLIITIGSIILILSILLGLAITWVRSRGKFMFLDNVANNRALVTHPWKKYRIQGNGLFVWMLVFGLVNFLIFGGLIAAALFVSWPMMETDAFDVAKLPTLIGIGLAFVVLIFVASYIATLLENFVLPIMYRDRIGTRAAWRRVLSLHSSNPGIFILYYFWMILLGMGTGILVLVAILVTCCIAGLVMIIPYLGAVLLLPITVFFRCLGMETLRQFGAEYDPFPEVSEEPALLTPPTLPG